MTWKNYFGRPLGIFYKINMHLPSDSAIPILCMYQKIIKIRAEIKESIVKVNKTINYSSSRREN